MTRRRITSTQLDTLIALAARKIELGDAKLKRLGATPEDLAARRETHNHASTWDVGSTIDLYDNGDTYLCMAVADDRKTCTLQKINNTSRR